MALDADRARSTSKTTVTEPPTNLIDIFDAGRNLVTTAAEPALGTLTYRDFLDAVGVAVYVTDADGRITFFNRAAEHLWGRRPAIGDEWCGSLRLLFTDGAPMRHEECPMAIALKEQRPTHGGEAIAVRPDGSRVSFVAYPTPLMDRGTMIGAVNVLVDVTERRRAEEALQATAGALRVSNAVKDEFLGLVSHELRTPVTTIFGNAQILRERGDALSAEDQRSMVVDIAEDSERLLAVIENLLLLTRLGSGTLPDLEPQVMNHLVSRVVGAFARRNAERPVELIGVEGEIVIVDADQTYVDLVLLNFLSNADKYSAPGSPIDVVLETGDGEARVRVLDRGIGVLPDEVEQLFAPFFRSDEAKRSASGIGVGLAVCMRVVDGHGGRIWAAPRAGGGSEFGFSLPVRSHGLETA
jgi:PAS domain S-box-containing protein